MDLGISNLLDLLHKLLAEWHDYFCVDGRNLGAEYGAELRLSLLSSASRYIGKVEEGNLSITTQRSFRLFNRLVRHDGMGNMCARDRSGQPGRLTNHSIASPRLSFPIRWNMQHQIVIPLRIQSTNRLSLFRALSATFCFLRYTPQPTKQLTCFLLACIHPRIQHDAVRQSVETYRGVV
jgi:hypothetical protein